MPGRPALLLLRGPRLRRPRRMPWRGRPVRPWWRRWRLRRPRWRRHRGCKKQCRCMSASQMARMSMAGSRTGRSSAEAPCRGRRRRPCRWPRALGRSWRVCRVGGLRSRRRAAAATPFLQRGEIYSFAPALRKRRKTLRYHFLAAAGAPSSFLIPPWRLALALADRGWAARPHMRHVLTPVRADLPRWISPNLPQKFATDGLAGPRCHRQRRDSFAPVRRNRPFPFRSVPFRSYSFAPALRNADVKKSK